MSLSEVLLKCFENWYSLRGGTSICTYNNAIRSSLSFMTVPLKENDAFEIPVTALKPLSNSRNSIGTVDNIAMFLSSNDYVPFYKTLDATLKNTLHKTSEGAKLLRITHSNDEHPYYCSFGAIYDRNYHPIMMCSWIVQLIKEPEVSEAPYSFHLVRPILRVDPQVFIDRSNPIERYIVNKIIPAALTISPNHCYHLPFSIRDSSRSFRVKVEIDNCPFRITKPVTPTIETTNEALLKVALDNIDNIIE